MMKTELEEQVKKFVFTFCQWETGRGYCFKPFSYPPSLIDRWNQFLFETNHFNEITNTIDNAAQEVIKELSEEIEDLKHESGKYSEPLKGKLDFYRGEASKLRKFLDENKIGRANQKIFDALYDHLIQQSETIKLLTEALEYCDNKAYILVNTHGVFKRTDCLTDAKKMKTKIESVLEQSKPHLNNDRAD